MPLAKEDLCNQHGSQYLNSCGWKNKVVRNAVAVEHLATVRGVRVAVHR